MIKQIQLLLKQAGHYHGAIDGIVGAQTVQAVKSALGRMTSVKADGTQASVPNKKPTSDDLLWIAHARNLVGTKEIAGTANNPKILQMWERTFSGTGQAHRLKEAVWNTENTPWCGAFVGDAMVSAGLARHVPTSFPMARSWLKAGTKLDKPAYGCVVVFWRGSPTGSSGHVGFVVGKDKAGNLMVLGGNQGDAVNIKPFSKGRVLAYRWCGTQDEPAPRRYELPVWGVMVE